MKPVLASCIMITKKVVGFFTGNKMANTKFGRVIVISVKIRSNIVQNSKTECSKRLSSVKSSEL